VFRNWTLQAVNTGSPFVQAGKKKPTRRVGKFQFLIEVGGDGIIMLHCRKKVQRNSPSGEKYCFLRASDAEKHYFGAVSAGMSEETRVR
jgi:hypothetical protein